MTPDERSDDRIRAWLADSADEVGDPMRGMLDVLVRVSETPQSRGWRSRLGRSGGRSGDPLGADRASADRRRSRRMLGLAGLGVAVAGVGAGLIGSALMAQRTEPRTIVVAQDGSGDVTTIAGGVAMAIDGDEVVIHPGTYVERVTVEADLEIRGVGELESIIVQAPDEGGPRPDGSPGRVAFAFQGAAGSLANVTIVAHEDAVGISVDGAAAPNISNVVIESPAQAMDGTAAVRWSGGGGGVLHDSTVAGVLRMTGAGTAPLIEWNRLRGVCIVVQADGGAREDQPRPVIRENEIDGCPTGILVHIEAGSPELESNGLSLPGGTAVSLAGVTGARIEGNSIHDSATAIAIANPRGPVTVTDNILIGDAVGVSVYGRTDQVRIEGNQIRDGGIGINLMGGADPVLMDNLLCGNDVTVRGLPEGQAADGASETCPGASPSPGA